MRANPAARRAIRLLMLAALTVLLAGCAGARTNDHPTSDEAAPGMFPGEVVTQQGNESAALYLPVFIVAALVFILVEGLVIYIAIRYRRRGTDAAMPPQTHGHNLLEIAWTAIPFVIVMVMFVGSFLVLNRVNAVTTSPAVTVDVTAFQWQWTFEYPEHELSFTGAGKDGPEMVLPVNESVVINLHAQDVIHAFYVPAFFYKKDVVPGRTNSFEVIIEKPGTYGGQCAEFCGLAHADMYFTVRAVERPEYDAWVAAEIEKANATPTPPPPPPSGGPPPPGQVVQLHTSEADPLAFDLDTIGAKAGTVLTLEYHNDSTIPHNVAFYQGTGSSAPLIARTVEPGDAKPGPGDVQHVTFDVPSEPGAYYFDCQIHPAQMNGTFEVTP